MDKDEKTKVNLPMTCVCKDEGKEAARVVREKVDNLVGGEVDDPNFVTWCIHHMNWEYDSYVTMMASDMWCGVVVESPTEKIRIECDRIEDGLAEIILYLQEQKESAE